MATLDSDFADLAAVIADPLFPTLDQALRSGQHIDQHQPGAFQYLRLAQPWLEAHYARYGADLIYAPDGFFYLRPVGDRLPVSRLGAPEMLVGQSLALFYLEPATLEQGHVTQSQVMERLRDLLGEEQLILGLLPRTRGYSARHRTEQRARQAVATALRRLTRLGFIRALDEDRFELGAALMRFAEPARGAEDLHAAVARLVSGGEFDWEGAAPTEGGPLRALDGAEDGEEADEMDDDDEQEEP